VAPDKLKQLFTVLVNQGRLVKVKEDLYIRREAIDQLKSKLVDFLKKNKEITSSSSQTSPKPPGNSPPPCWNTSTPPAAPVRVGEMRRLREGV